MNGVSKHSYACAELEAIDKKIIELLYEKASLLSCVGIAEGEVKELLTLINNKMLERADVKKDRSLIVKEDRFATLTDIVGESTDNGIHGLEGFHVIAGPCAVESREQIDTVGAILKENGVRLLRGGIFKPRTSPYTFQGLGVQGLELMKNIGEKHNLVTVSEIADTKHIELFEEHIDVFQIGSRNMANYELLKAVGKTDKPILLKRGMSATIKEFVLAAEYIALQGNRKIILCERGIRTFENETRNTLDISCIPILKQETNLPVIVDLSHSLGRKDIINSIAKAAKAVGADGIMVEVHPEPGKALSDKEQQLNLVEFASMMNSLR